MHHDQAMILAQQALLAGAALKSPAHVSWHVAGNCSAPVDVERFVRPSAPLDKRHQRTIAVGPGTKRPIWVSMQTRCRKCASCRKAKRKMWTARAIAETRASQRTWFGTITLSPQSQQHVLNVARAKAHSGRCDFERLAPEVQLTRKIRVIGAEVTKALKRLRKNTGARLRYLLVVELHKSGQPHLHMLVHEQPGSAPVRHKQLKEMWNMGFSDWRLADVMDARAVAYTCKYLAKSEVQSARVRASLRYGDLGRKPPTPVGDSESSLERAKNDPQLPRKEAPMPDGQSPHRTGDWDCAEVEARMATDGPAESGRVDSSWSPARLSTAGEDESTISADSSERQFSSEEAADSPNRTTLPDI